MKLLQPVVYLLLYGIVEEYECTEFIFSDPPDLMNRTTDFYIRPSDFRCFVSALTDNFDFVTHYNNIGYALNTENYDHIGCTSSAAFYPILMGLDPMMPYYINNVHRLHPLALKSDDVMSRMTPLQRTKEYCAAMHLVAAAYLQYWESFHSERDLCMKMVDFIKICHKFRQMLEMFTAKLYDKLCLSEEGCYNVMDYYEEDLPYCVKYTAINEFKNSSVGSWHHTILNYCKLTGMVPGVEDTKYDMKILKEKGTTREKLTQMCYYLRYRVLPDEGKEQVIPDVADYEMIDAEATTDGTANGVSKLVATISWNVFYVRMSFAQKYLLE